MTGPLYLLRHGETEWNREGRMQGRLDAPLTARGRVQAARQGALLRRAGIVAPAYSSPLGRARATAALAGLVCDVDPALQEIDMGRWQGRVPDRPLRGVSWKFDAPGAEPRDALLARLAPTLARPGPAILVSHGVVVVALRATLLGLPLERWDALEDRQGVVYRLVPGSETVLG